MVRDVRVRKFQRIGLRQHRAAQIQPVRLREIGFVLHLVGRAGRGGKRQVEGSRRAGDRLDFQRRHILPDAQGERKALDDFIFPVAHRHTGAINTSPKLVSPVAVEAHVETSLAIGGHRAAGWIDGKPGTGRPDFPNGGNATEI